MLKATKREVLEYIDRVPGADYQNLVSVFGFLESSAKRKLARLRKEGLIELWGIRGYRGWVLTERGRGRLLYWWRKEKEEEG